MREDQHNSSSVPAACAVVTRNYLSYARILSRSYYAQYPDGRFYLLVLGGLPAGVSLNTAVRLVEPDDLGSPCLWEMAVRYSPFEMSCAVKPLLVAAILEKFGEEKVFYFDADIVMFRRLTEAEQQLETNDVLLTPHILQPMALDGAMPDELCFLRGGVFNMGFFAVRNTAQALQLLQWWSTRLRESCYKDIAAGVCHDQRWADLMPILFPFVGILRDVTYNVAYWNLQERCVEESQVGFQANGRPLAFFHFSGLDLGTRQFRQTHQTRITLHDGSPTGKLVADYVRAHDLCGRSESMSWENGLDRFDNGVAFHPLLRQIYLSLDEERRVAFGNPFRTGIQASFFDWVIRPDPVISPFLRALYNAVPELRAEFHICEESARHEFLTWARTVGARTHGFDPALVP